MMNDTIAALATGGEAPCQVRAFHGNFLVVVKALAYLDTLGGEGIREAAAQAAFQPVKYGHFRPPFRAKSPRACNARPLWAWMQRALRRVVGPCEIARQFIPCRPGRQAKKGSLLWQ